MAVAVESEALPGVRRGVLCVPEAHWLRWADGWLQVGDREGRVHALEVSADALTLVGRTFSGLRLRAGERRLGVAARFAAGATVLIDRRGGRCAVAASPAPARRGTPQPIELAE